MRLALERLVLLENCLTSEAARREESDERAPLAGERGELLGEWRGELALGCAAQRGLRDVLPSEDRGRAARHDIVRDN